MAKSRKRRRKRRRPAEHRAPQLQGAGGQVAEQREKPPPQSPRRAAARDERPPAPWGSFPLQELTVLVALIAYEFFRHRESRAWIRSRRDGFTLEEIRQAVGEERSRRGTRPQRRSPAAGRPG